MTRTLAPLFAILLSLLVLLPACSQTPEVEDETDQACLEGVFSILVYSDPASVVIFDDGREFEIHNTGWVEVTWSEGDPVVFSMTDLNGDILTYEEVVATAEVFPVIETDGGFQTGASLEPVEGDPPWVVWNCPTVS